LVGDVTAASSRERRALLRTPPAMTRSRRDMAGQKDRLTAVMNLVLCWKRIMPAAYRFGAGRQACAACCCLCDLLPSPASAFPSRLFCAFMKRRDCAHSCILALLFSSLLPFSSPCCSTRGGGIRRHGDERHLCSVVTPCHFVLCAFGVTAAAAGMLGVGKGAAEEREDTSHLLFAASALLRHLTFTIPVSCGCRAPEVSLRFA